MTMNLINLIQVSYIKSGKLYQVAYVLFSDADCNKAKIYKNVSYKLWNVKKTDCQNNLLKRNHKNVEFNVLIRSKLDACEVSIFYVHIFRLDSIKHLDFYVQIEFLVYRARNPSACDIKTKTRKSTESRRSYSFKRGTG